MQVSLCYVSDAARHLQELRMVMGTMQARWIQVMAAGLLLGATSPVWADRNMATTAAQPPGDKGAPQVGIQLAVLLPQAFSPLHTHIMAQIEAGYLLPFAKRLLGVTGSFAFSSPTTSGSGLVDARVPGGSFDYSSTEQHFLLGLTVWANIPLGRVVPYIGIGPRIYAVRTFSSGSAQSSLIPETLETSTEAGVGLPVGVNVLLGPGRAFAEFQLLWAGIAQRSTGDGSVGSMTLGAGYRFVF